MEPPACALRARCGDSRHISRPWRGAANELLAELRIDRTQVPACYDDGFAARLGLRGAVYFDRQTYGRDQMVNARLYPWHDSLPIPEPTLNMQRAIPDLPHSAEWATPPPTSEPQQMVGRR